jgi:hypothetical protein
MNLRYGIAGIGVLIAAIVIFCLLLSLSPPMSSRQPFTSSGGQSVQQIPAALPATHPYVIYFYRTSCPACHAVLESGILDRAAINATVIKYNLELGEGQDEYMQVINRYHLRQTVPMTVLISAGSSEVPILIGSDEIIGRLEIAINRSQGT